MGNRKRFLAAIQNQVIHVQNGGQEQAQLEMQHLPINEHSMKNSHDAIHHITHYVCCMDTAVW